MNPYDHPQWQKKRLQIMNRDGFRCARCGNDQIKLNVHHRRYEWGKALWEVDDEDLVTLCQPCHESIHGIRPASSAVNIREIIANFSESRHEYMRLIAGKWVCECGCGLTMTDEDFKKGHP